MADQGCESDSDIVSQIKLRSSDGEVFRVPTDAAKMSNTIKNMLDDLGCFDCSSQNEAEAIPLSRVHSYVLEKVISWMSHHCRSRLDGSAIGSGAAAAVAGVGVGADVAAGEDDFDREFLQIDQGTLLEIMLAANYLYVFVEHSTLSNRQSFFDCFEKFPLVHRTLIRSNRAARWHVKKGN